MSDTTSFRDKVAAYFKAHPGEWVTATTLDTIGGRQAWRTRVSNCRKQLGMHIDNRQRRVTWHDEPIVISEYRYLPRDNEPTPLLRGHDTEFTLR